MAVWFGANDDPRAAMMANAHQESTGSKSSAAPAAFAPAALDALDALLTAQILVAWAGESADDAPRIGWWRSDLVSEYGGQDLFRRLMPKTWEWAVLQAVREAASRVDRATRSRHHEPDSIHSRFHLGFEIDEHAEERLLELKASGQTPIEALPDLALLNESWSREAFETWLRSHGEARSTSEPIGRRVRAPGPELGGLVRSLVGALLPLAETYPLPHVLAGR